MTQLKQIFTPGFKRKIEFLEARSTEFRSADKKNDYIVGRIEETIIFSSQK